MSDKKGPVLFELEEPSDVSPAEAPPVQDVPQLNDAAAMQKVAVLTARRPSPAARWFWRALLALVGFAVSVAAWDFVTGLLERSAVLGLVALVLVTVMVAMLLVVGVKEWAAYARLKRVDDLHRAADAALADRDLGAAREVVDRLDALYRDRDELSWHRERLAERRGDVFDADGLFGLAEETLLKPLDTAARREVEAAARQVATVTAVVPLALADVAVALTANLRMIRRLGEIYGGRAGTLGSWRLTRTVMTHLVATGAVAVGDDLIGSVAGGGMLSKVSRRFGEGIVNAALTARVGVAAMEVCRPLPFRGQRAPRVTRLVQRALAGLFSRGEG